MSGSLSSGAKHCSLGTAHKECMKSALMLKHTQLPGIVHHSVH